MYNTCDCAGERPDQWLFLGCSISSFSCQAGFNDEGTTLTVQLIEDPESTCNGRTKKYLNEKFETEETTGPDPGFFGLSMELIGRPVLFKFGSFEFAGLISDWAESNSSTGIGLYSVTIESPVFLLSALTLILDKYNGSVNGIPNVANLYGLFESNTCETFGNSENFGNGMSWNMIRAGLALLIGVISPYAPALDYLQSNRIKYLVGLSGGYGLIREDNTGYLLDLAELPVAPDFYRFSGTTVNFLDILNTFSDDSSFDWFAELYPCCIDDVVLKVIKIRVIDRSVPPVANAIPTFIDALATGENSCGLISYDVGEEQRDDILHSMIIGPSKQQIYSAEWTRTDDPTRIERDVMQGAATNVVEVKKYWKKIPGEPPQQVNVPIIRKKYTVTEDVETDVFDLSDDIIAPYWGKNTSGNVIPTYTVDFYPDDPILSTGPDRSEVFFGGNGVALNERFFLMVAPDTVEVGEFEMMAALAGFDQWESYVTMNYSHTWRIVQAARDFVEFAQTGIGLHNLHHMINIFQQQHASGAFIKPMHMLALRKIDAAHPLLNEIENDVRTIYEWVLNYAQEFYGRQFMVRVPDICVAYDEDTNSYKYNFQVSEGGWNEWGGSEFSTLLDLAIPSTYIDFFRLEDGRIQAFCKFDDANLLHFDQLSTEDYGYYDSGLGHLWVKCEVNPEIVFLDKSTLSSPRVVFTIPQTIRLKDNNIWVEKDGTIDLIRRRGDEWVSVALEQWSGDISSSLGATTTKGYGSERAMQPNAVAIPLQNNVETYGPWIATNGIGIGGNVRVEEDQGLVPWVYGSMTELNSVAQAQVNEGVSTLYYTESGNITMPGIPTGRIGDELLSINGSAYVPNQFYAETRDITSHTTYVGGVEYIEVEIVAGSYIWIGTYGPIINNITCSIAESGITTSYNLSSFKKKFRKFSKVKINRLKELADLRQSFYRNV